MGQARKKLQAQAAAQHRVSKAARKTAPRAQSAPTHIFDEEGRPTRLAPSLTGWERLRVVDNWAEDRLPIRAGSPDAPPSSDSSDVSARDGTLGPVDSVSHLFDVESYAEVAKVLTSTSTDFPSAIPGTGRLAPVCHLIGNCQMVFPPVISACRLGVRESRTTFFTVNGMECACEGKQFHTYTAAEVIIRKILSHARLGYQRPQKVDGEKVRSACRVERGLFHETESIRVYDAYRYDGGVLMFNCALCSVGEEEKQIEGLDGLFRHFVSEHGGAEAWGFDPRFMAIARDAAMEPDDKIWWPEAFMEGCVRHFLHSLVVHDWAVAALEERHEGETEEDESISEDGSATASLGIFLRAVLGTLTLQIRHPNRPAEAGEMAMRFRCERCQSYLVDLQQAVLHIEARHLHNALDPLVRFTLPAVDAEMRKRYEQQPSDARSWRQEMYWVWVTALAAPIPLQSPPDAAGLQAARVQRGVCAAKTRCRAVAEAAAILLDTALDKVRCLRGRGHTRVTCRVVGCSEFGQELGTTLNAVVSHTRRHLTQADWQRARVADSEARYSLVYAEVMKLVEGATVAADECLRESYDGVQPGDNGEAHPAGVPWKAMAAGAFRQVTSAWLEERRTLLETFASTSARPAASFPSSPPPFPPSHPIPSSPTNSRSSSPPTFLSTKTTPSAVPNSTPPLAAMGNVYAVPLQEGVPPPNGYYFTYTRDGYPPDGYGFPNGYAWDGNIPDPNKYPFNYYDPGGYGNPEPSPPPRYSGYDAQDFYGDSGRIDSPPRSPPRAADDDRHDSGDVDGGGFSWSLPPSPRRDRSRSRMRMTRRPDPHVAVAVDPETVFGLRYQRRDPWEWPSKEKERKRSNDYSKLRAKAEELNGRYAWRFEDLPDDHEQDHGAVYRKPSPPPRPRYEPSVCPDVDVIIEKAKEDGRQAGERFKKEYDEMMEETKEEREEACDQAKSELVRDYRETCINSKWYKDCSKPEYQDRSKLTATQLQRLQWKEEMDALFAEEDAKQERRRAIERQQEHDWLRGKGPEPKKTHPTTETKKEKTAPDVASEKSQAEAAKLAKKKKMREELDKLREEMFGPSIKQEPVDEAVHPSKASMAGPQIKKEPADDWTSGPSQVPTMNKPIKKEPAADWEHDAYHARMASPAIKKEPTAYQKHGSSRKSKANPLVKEEPIDDRETYTRRRTARKSFIKKGRRDVVVIDLTTPEPEPEPRIKAEPGDDIEAIGLTEAPTFKQEPDNDSTIDRSQPSIKPEPDDDWEIDPSQAPMSSRHIREQADDRESDAWQSPTPAQPERVEKRKRATVEQDRADLDLNALPGPRKRARAHWDEYSENEDEPTTITIDDDFIQNWRRKREADDPEYHLPWFKRKKKSPEERRRILEEIHEYAVPTQQYYVEHGHDEGVDLPPFCE